MKNKEYLVFFDTETTGLPKDYKAFWNLDNTSACRLIQLAYIITDTDGNIVKKVNEIVKPLDFTIKNSHLHGITQEQAISKGFDIDVVLKPLIDLIHNNKVTLIAHNIDFDLFVLNSEIYRVQVKKGMQVQKHYFVQNNCKTYCTMKTTTNLVKIKGKYEGKYKYPKLIELGNFLYNTGSNIVLPDENTLHQANVDTELLMQCYFALKNK